MDVYRTDRIRNVVLLGHGGSGKTTLAEAMAYLAGMTSRLGRVEDGNTVSDFDKEEIKRQFSIHTSVVPIEWDNVKINILDTPGFFDFDMREIQAAEDDFRDGHGYRQCKLQGCGAKAAGALRQENSSIPSANQRE